MARYLGRRLLLMVPAALLVSIIVFSVVRLIPGDVVDMMVEEYAYAPTVEALRERLGLDRPLVVQYADWLGGVLRGDLGVSLWRGNDTAQELLERFPITLELALLTLLITVVVALPLSVLAATHPDSLVDYLGRGGAILFLSVPGFWVATLALVLPAMWWGWLPPLTYTPFFEDPLKNLAQLALPALILGIDGAAPLMRLTRAMILEVLREDYIRTAWAKGLAERAVVYRHALKNALIPVVTLIGLRVPVLLGGTVIMETIFGIPGVGRWIVESLTYRDYPVLQAGVLLYCALVMLTNLVVDLTYGWLNPSIRYS
jgi:peptide/nickel transport system permease protein